MAKRYIHFYSNAQDPKTYARWGFTQLHQPSTQQVLILSTSEGVERQSQPQRILNSEGDNKYYCEHIARSANLPASSTPGLKSKINKIHINQ